MPLICNRTCVAPLDHQFNSGIICQALSKEGLSVSRAAWRNSVVIGMQFCPKCGMALTPTKKEKIVVLTCPKCGQESKRSDPVMQKLEKAKESIVVIGKGKNMQTLPTMKVSCQKCGQGEAFYWMVQTRGGDEASTQFFRCTKCGATWRESS